MDWRFLVVVFGCLAVTGGVGGRVRGGGRQRHHRNINSSAEKENDSKEVSSSIELQCPSCEKIHCTPRRASKLKCQGGITKGICNCCPVCAKVEGEECGGEWDYLGKCDRGLYCKPKKSADGGDSYKDWEMYGTHGAMTPRSKKPEGICVKIPPGQAGDEALPAYCQPKCSPEYCIKHPKAICAALEVTERKQDCQGDCQHTSCSACRFVQDEPDCVKCRKDDFPCMKKFARCIKKQVCTRMKFPCKRTKMNSQGKFMCVVPGCLDS